MAILRYAAVFLFLGAVTAAGIWVDSFPDSQESETSEAEVPARVQSGATVEVQYGDLSQKDGTATVREEFIKPYDDLATSQDESNDQPLGHMGTVTLRVQNVSSGHEYPLDADLTDDVNGYRLERLYFRKGGWVDFDDCILDTDYTGPCDDENDRSWEIEGQE